MQFPTNTDVKIHEKLQHIYKKRYNDKMNYLLQRIKQSSEIVSGQLKVGMYCRKVVQLWLIDITWLTCLIRS